MYAGTQLIIEVSKVGGANLKLFYQLNLQRSVLTKQ